MIIGFSQKLRKSLKKQDLSRDLKSSFCYEISIENGLADATISDDRVKAEVESITERYLNLKPKVVISYDRYSMKGLEDKKVRVTVDSNIRYKKL